MNKAHAFKVSIVTTEGQVFDDDVMSLIVPGTLGYLGLQTDHAPIMTSLKPGKLTMTGAKGLEGGPTASPEKKQDVGPIAEEEPPWRINLLIGEGFLENSWDPERSTNRCRIVTRGVEFADMQDYEQVKAFRESAENRLRQLTAVGKQSDGDREAVERIDRLIKAAGKKMIEELK
ncbi:MAG: F0F1 ATP synthase subunit epsilon [candidate division Zixibacteria bacterium]|nr:F0F1 ATP synthase subunit epsilon [candidate division Zixibacteria bacterium]